MYAAVGEIVDADCEIVQYPVDTRGKCPKRLCVPRGQDDITTFVKTARQYEYDLSASVYTRAARGGSFVEVGANIGTDTVMASDFFKSCYVFEPAARHMELLRKNIELNGITNVQTFCAAVSNQCGPGRLYSGEKNKSGSASLRQNNPDMQASEEVQTVTLDTALPGVMDVTYIHIDAEGHDVKVLQGAYEFIKRQLARPYIKMEFQPQTMSLHGSHVSELIEFMEEFKYRGWFNASNFVVPLSPGILIDMYYLWKKTPGWIDIYLGPE